MSDSQNKFKDRYARTHTLAQLLVDFDRCVATQEQVSIAGRVMAKRDMGKSVFVKLQSADGAIQGYASRNDAEVPHAVLTTEVAVGDIVGLTGTAFLTRTQERSVKAASATLLSKAQQLLPDKFHGISDQEIRYRQRYLDLIMHEDVRKVFRARFMLINRLRALLSQDGFIEVETPILQAAPGGAAARPFVTRHNSLDIDLYLRISPETYLKRLIVGGFEKVFEIGKNFRNEGLDPSHLQEFTMLEFYAAYANYKDNIVFTRRLIQDVVEHCIGSLQLSFRGTALNLSGDWETITYRDLLLRDTGIDVLGCDTAEALLAQIKERSIAVETHGKPSLGTLIDRLYKKVSRPKLIQPTILTGHPMTLLPLARPNDEDPRIADAFQVLIHGWEIVKAYSELADPIVQRRLLEEQAGFRTQGDEEAMFIDEDFLRSLEYGMPPVSGVGLGIDRLVTIITDQFGLRDVVLFPVMR